MRATSEFSRLHNLAAVRVGLYGHFSGDIDFDVKRAVAGVDAAANVGIELDAVRIADRALEQWMPRIRGVMGSAADVEADRRAVRQPATHITLVIVSGTAIERDLEIIVYGKCLIWCEDCSKVWHDVWSRSIDLAKAYSAESHWDTKR